MGVRTPEPSSSGFKGRLLLAQCLGNGESLGDSKREVRLGVPQCHYVIEVCLINISVSWSDILNEITGKLRKVAK